MRRVFNLIPFAILLASLALPGDASAQADQQPATKKSADAKQSKKTDPKAKGTKPAELPDVSRKRPKIEKPTKGTVGPFHELRRAMALLAKARIGQARSVLERVVREIPEHAEAWHMLATCHELKDDRVRARSCGKRALELEPEHARAALLLARLHEREDKIAATDFARRAIKHAGKDIVVKRSAARILMETGNLDEAKKIVEELNKVTPGSQRLLYLRAELAIAMREMDIAKKCYELLGFMRRHDPIPFENLSSIYEQEGDLKRAIKSIERAIRARSSKRELHHTRIRLLVARGASQDEIREARKELSKALESQDESSDKPADAPTPSPKR